MTGRCHLIQGDARQLPFADGTVNLIVTSPPYADARSKTYGGVHPDRYVGWFRPFGDEFARVLAPDGSFVLNIKERVVDGERHGYVMDLIRDLRARGWRFVEEYIWRKSNSAPGKWPNRFRDAWERCLHFTRERHFYMDQDAVRVKAGDWQTKRMPRESRNDGHRHESTSGSKFGRRVQNWAGRTLAYPDNVLSIAPVSRNVGHPAPFPLDLPRFFVKLFSRPGDVVLDPFGGAATTGLACLELGRVGYVVERKWDYLLIGRNRAANHRPRAAKRHKPRRPTNPVQMKFFAET